MKKIKIFGTLLIIASLLSCDKRKDYFGENNKGAVVNYHLLNSHSGTTSTLNGDYLIDTLKLGQNYKMNLSISDEAQSVSVSFTGQGGLLVDGLSFTSGKLTNGTHLFEWVESTEGTFEFDIKVTDNYGVENIRHFKIVVFENKVPYTYWTVENVGALNPLEKEIVVYGTDQDEIYGGSILYYQYIINGDTTNNPYNHLNYIFPSAGNYFISVRAMDSNWEWGNQISINNYPIN